jgi:hypothetical protein
MLGLPRKWFSGWADVRTRCRTAWGSVHTAVKRNAYGGDGPNSEESALSPSMSMPFPSSAMGSGRLFLDRGARQCPSPPRRQGQHKTLDRRTETNYHRTARCGLTACLTLGVHLRKSLGANLVIQASSFRGSKCSRFRSSLGLFYRSPRDLQLTEPGIRKNTGSDRFITPEDQLDYEGFLQGIAFFLRLTPEQIMDHLKIHKEDGWSYIRGFDGRGLASCTRAGMNHLESLVQRRVGALLTSKDLDSHAVLRELTRKSAPRSKRQARTEWTYYRHLNVSSRMP